MTSEIRNKINRAQMELQELLTMIHAHRKAIQQRIADLQCGHELFFAIDFSELYTYAYPLARSMTIRDIKTLEAMFDYLVRTQYGLTTALYSNLLGRIYLLKPYTIELYDYLEMIKHGIFGCETEELAQEAVDKGVADEGTRLRNLESILYKTKAKMELNHSETVTIVDYFRENFKYVYYSFLNSREPGMQAIFDVKSNGSLFILEKHEIGGIEIDLKEAYDNHHEWLKLIESYPDRDRPVKAKANRLDAIAAAMFEQYNRISVKNGKALLFLSSAPTMDYIFDQHPIGVGPPSAPYPGNPVRSQEYVFVAAKYWQKDSHTMLKLLQSSESLASEYESDLEELIYKLEQLEREQKNQEDQLNELVGDSNDLQGRVRSRLNEYENLQCSLFENRREVLKSRITTIAEEKGKFKELLKLIIDFLSSPIVSQELKNQLEKKYSELKSCSDELRAILFGSTHLSRSKRPAIDIVEKDRYWEVSFLFINMRYWINLKNKDVVERLRRIKTEETVLGYSLNREIYMKMLELQRDESLSRYEIGLIKAVLLIQRRYYKKALEEIERIDMISVNLKNESNFLKALCYLQMNEWQVVAEVVYSLVRDYNKYCPRELFVYTNAMQHLVEDKKRFRIGDKEIGIDEVREAFKRAEKQMVSGTCIRMMLLNNYAWFIYKNVVEYPDMMGEAYKLIVESLSILKKKDVRCKEIYDTANRICLYLYDHIERSPIDRETIVDQVKEYVGKLEELIDFELPSTGYERKQYKSIVFAIGKGRELLEQDETEKRKKRVDEARGSGLNN